MCLYVAVKACMAFNILQTYEYHIQLLLSDEDRPKFEHSKSDYECPDVTITKCFGQEMPLPLGLRFFLYNV